LELPNRKSHPSPPHPSPRKSHPSPQQAGLTHGREHSPIAGRQRNQQLDFVTRPSCCASRLLAHAAAAVRGGWWLPGCNAGALPATWCGWAARRLSHASTRLRCCLLPPAGQPGNAVGVLRTAARWPGTLCVYVCVGLTSVWRAGSSESFQPGPTTDHCNQPLPAPSLTHPHSRVSE